MIGDLTDVHTLRSALRQFGVPPTKHLSQNFLIDREVLGAMVAAADLPPDAAVLEVGAGTGVLTRELGQKCKRVLAVELDRRIIPLLRETTGTLANVEILEENILRQPAEFYTEHLGNPATYHVVANLPYHITARFLQHFLESEKPPATFTLLLQQEVAERMCAAPGDLSLLALSVQVFGEPAVVASVPRTAFWPMPKVTSAILHIRRYPQPLWPETIRVECFRLAKLGFQHRRKTLINALAGSLRRKPSELQVVFQRCDLSLQARAQELTLDQWRALAQVLR